MQNNLNDLDTLDIHANGFRRLNHVHEKWTKYFTTVEENRLISQLKEDKRFQRLSDTGIINVGITTGNNKYFSINQETADAYELTDMVRPLIGRSSHAHSVYFRLDDWRANVMEGKAAYLIDFPDKPFEEYTQRQKEYIRLGEETGANEGYKCRIRECWYQIPSIWETLRKEVVSLLLL